MADIRNTKEEEVLFLHLESLNENCIKRTYPEWFQFNIYELLHGGKVDVEPIGNNCSQFCKCCGEQVYISNEPDRQQTSWISEGDTCV